jgi:hypothetical protein
MQRQVLTAYQRMEDWIYPQMNDGHHNEAVRIFII